MEDDRQDGELLDGGIPPLTRAIDLEKRARKFDKNHKALTHRAKNVADRRKSARKSHSDHPSHHTEEESPVYPHGLRSTLQPLAPASTRRRSYGGVREIPERHGRVEYNRWNPNGDGQNNTANVPPGSISATIKPTGVPMDTEQAAWEIQDAAGNELIIHRLEEIEERKTEMASIKHTAYALRGFGSFNVTFGRWLYGLALKNLRDVMPTR